MSEQQEQLEEVNKLKEEIAKRLYHLGLMVKCYPDDMDIWEDEPIATQMYYRKRVTSLLRDLPIPLYLDTGEPTDEKIEEATCDITEASGPNWQYRAVVRATRAKFVSIGKVMK